MTFENVEKQKCSVVDNIWLPLIDLKKIVIRKGKNYKMITKKDMNEYRVFCLRNYKINGNVIRLNSINNFVCNFLKRHELRISVPKSVKINKQLLSSEEIKLYVNSAETPLEKLIVTYQIDGLFRPGEFYKLMISQHDINNQIIYVDDTKTGDNSVIFTPNMIKRYIEYLPYRIQPKRKTDEDKLIIIDRGSHYGLAPSPNSDFIYRKTKKIALRAGFKRSVYPYLIKPSAITDGFNKKTDPGILQRQARHRNVETTLRYNHNSDKIVKDFYNKVQLKINDNPTVEDKAKVWLDKLLINEIDLKTFKMGIDVLLPQKQKNDEDVGYI